MLQLEHSVRTDSNGDLMRSKGKNIVERGTRLVSNRLQTFFLSLVTYEERRPSSSIDNRLLPPLHGGDNRYVRRIQALKLGSSSWTGQVSSQTYIEGANKEKENPKEEQTGSGSLQAGT